MREISCGRFFVSSFSSVREGGDNFCNPGSMVGRFRMRNDWFAKLHRGGRIEPRGYRIERDDKYLVKKDIANREREREILSEIFEKFI